jgi:hypothetical protein
MVFRGQARIRGGSKRRGFGEEADRFRREEDKGT